MERSGTARESVDTREDGEQLVTESLESIIREMRKVTEDTLRLLQAKHVSVMRLGNLDHIVLEEPLRERGATLSPFILRFVV